MNWPVIDCPILAAVKGVFPGAAGNYLRQIAQRMDILIFYDLLEIVINKTIFQGIAVKYCHQSSENYQSKIFFFNII